MKLKFFNLAEKLSLHSNHPFQRHGSVIVHKNRVIGTGFNKDKTHPNSPHLFSHIHAEFAAILNSRREDFRGCEIYVFRRNKLNQIADSKPCMYCMKIIKDLQFNKIHYSTYDGYKTDKLK